MKNINKFLAVAVMALAAVSARASLDIPNGSSVGLASSVNVTGMSSISTLSVSLNISGGNNGDLYAYLSYNGVTVTLLNRPGTSPGNPLGFTDAGYNVTVDDVGVNGNLNSATGGSPVTGDFTAANGSFSSFTGTGNGTWTLFIADLSGGGTGSDSQLNSWYLNINESSVPEPVTWALLVFAGGVLTVAGGRRLLKRMA